MSVFLRVASELLGDNVDSEMVFIDTYTRLETLCADMNLLAKVFAIKLETSENADELFEQYRELGETHNAIYEMAFETDLANPSDF